MGANWSGRHGHTGGEALLTTAPEQDLGFPYEAPLEFEDWRSYYVENPPDRDTWQFATVPNVEPQIAAHAIRYSWPTYLARNRMLARWVAMERHHPTLHEWSEYLKWAWGVLQEDAKRVDLKVSLVRTEVKDHSIRLTEDGWAAEDIEGVWNVLFVTGPGNARSLTQPGSADRIPIDNPNNVPGTQPVWDSETYWTDGVTWNMEQPGNAIIIVGNGGAAGAVIDDALRRWPGCHIEHFASQLPWTQGRSPLENQYATDPLRWHFLNPDDREHVKQHSVQGVFAPSVHQRIADAHRGMRYRFTLAKAKRIQVVDIPIEPGSFLNLEYLPNDPRQVDDQGKPRTMSHHAQAAIFCVGYRPEAPVEWIVESEEKCRIPVATSDASKWDEGLGYTLHDRARIVWPGLASDHYGPSLGTLGYLGGMAERVCNGLRVFGGFKPLG